MKSDGHRSETSRRQGASRKYFDMGFNYGAARGGYFLENIDALAPPGLCLTAAPGRGFPKYSEPPRFVFDRKRGVSPRDLEPFHDFWLASDRAKAIFQAVDLDAFAFVQCDVRLPQGNYDGPNYWLCDVIRVLDAVDEEQSRVKTGIGQNPDLLSFGQKYYNLLPSAELRFKDDVVGNAHIFRMAYLERTIICDQILRGACKSAGFTGLRFDDASNL